MSSNDDLMDRVMRQHAQVHGRRTEPICFLGRYMRGIPCKQPAKHVVPLVALVHHAEKCAVPDDVSPEIIGQLMGCLECSRQYRAWVVDNFGGEWEEEKAKLRFSPHEVFVVGAEEN